MATKGRYVLCEAAILGARAQIEPDDGTARRQLREAVGRMELAGEDRRAVEAALLGGRGLS